MSPHWSRNNVILNSSYTPSPASNTFQLYVLDQSLWPLNSTFLKGKMGRPMSQGQRSNENVQKALNFVPGKERKLSKWFSFSSSKKHAAFLSTLSDCIVKNGSLWTLLQVETFIVKMGWGKYTASCLSLTCSRLPLSELLVYPGPVCNKTEPVAFGFSLSWLDFFWK